MHTLLPNGTLCGSLKILGAHWGGISAVYRALGARVGSRVFWPGTGVHVVEHDLLEVGDDVTFGSRSAILAADAFDARRVVLQPGSNVADRCVLLPGVSVGRHGVLGSGSLAPTGTTYGANAIALGSRNGSAELLYAGDAGDARTSKAMEAAQQETLRPFGRAFYGGAPTPYWLPPPALFALYAAACELVKAWLERGQKLVAIALVTSLLPLLLPMASGSGPGGTASGSIDQLSAWLRRNLDPELGALSLLVYAAALLLPALVAVHAAASALALLIDIGGKWLIIGRRRAGRWPWDESSYPMRWKLYLNVAAIAARTIDALDGTPLMNAYYRLHGASVGAGACLFPKGSDPRMTEPDLVTIGEGACINDAFVICHTNSRGELVLSPIAIGAGATVRGCSRVMGGSVLEPGALMLEHTLTGVGDHVSEGMAWQGWPVRSIRTRAEAEADRREACAQASRAAAAMAEEEEGGGEEQGEVRVVDGAPCREEQEGARARLRGGATAVREMV